MILQPLWVKTLIQITVQLTEFGQPSDEVGKSNAIVHTADSHGQRITTGGANVIAKQGVYVLLEQDNKDGTYTFKYFTYYPQAVSVCINGKQMKGQEHSLC